MAEFDPVFIDGAHGEGGGQIVRTSLALAMITGRALKLGNIRGRRRKPGLRAQHLTAAQACVSVSSGHIVGAQLGKRELSFTPKGISPGNYQFSIGTAGAATLVLQTLLPPLLNADGESLLAVTGGTHVPWSPSYQYFTEVFLPTIAWLGYQCEASLSRWGWYPRGGGKIQAVVKNVSHPRKLLLDKPFELERITGISASSRLPEHVMVRQKRQLRKRLEAIGIQAEIDTIDTTAANPGSFVFIHARGRHSVAGFSSLGERGKPAEKVADEAADALLRFLETRSALDQHLADQILIYLAMTPGKDRFTTAAITQHLLTNAWVIEQFLPVQFEISGALGEPGFVVKLDRKEK